MGFFITVFWSFAAKTCFYFQALTKQRCDNKTVLWVLKIQCKHKGSFVLLSEKQWCVPLSNSHLSFVSLLWQSGCENNSMRWPLAVHFPPSCQLLDLYPHKPCLSTQFPKFSVKRKIGCTTAPQCSTAQIHLPNIKLSLVLCSIWSKTQPAFRH